jgi:CubicO group peptidase (beta-lactamase class C family)
VSSIVVAILVDRGLLSYETKISDIWPEFGANGKDAITVEDLMRHESGLHEFDFSVQAVHCQRSILKSGNNNILSRQIASSKVELGEAAEKPPRKYHFITRGFIINEIVMRVDPKKRTVGEFLRDEIATPLQLCGKFTVGPETLENSHKIAPLVPNRLSWIVAQIFNVFGRKSSLVAFIHQILMLKVS